MALSDTQSDLTTWVDSSDNTDDAITDGTRPVIVVHQGYHARSVVDDVIDAIRLGGWRVDDRDGFRDEIAGADREGWFSGGWQINIVWGLSSEIARDRADTVRDAVRHSDRTPDGKRDEIVVVPISLADVADDASQLRGWLDRVLTDGDAVALPDDDDRVVIESGSVAARAAVAVATGVDRLDGIEYDLDSARDSGRIPWLDGSVEHSGRPPVGFEVIDGVLSPADNFEEGIRPVLITADRGDIAKAEAARQLDVDPRTVRRILDERRALYRLG